MPTTPQQMIDMLDEHLPYEISMMMAMHDQAQGPLDQLTGNVVIESFCIHARNLFEFFIKTSNGGEKNNYAFARAFVPKFVEFKIETPSRQRSACSARSALRSRI